MEFIRVDFDELKRLWLVLAFVYHLYLTCSSFTFKNWERVNFFPSNELSVGGF